MYSFEIDLIIDKVIMIIILKRIFRYIVFFKFSIVLNYNIRSRNVINVLKNYLKGYLDLFYIYLF